ncbi:MAG: hypothetical protein HMLIMOIP_001459 [Candidatus Nitrosomirales archaeon]|jgi:hypothetical protein
MDRIHIRWKYGKKVLSILTIAVLAVGIIAFMPEENVSAIHKGKSKSGWHPSDPAVVGGDGHYPLGKSDPCATDEDLEDDPTGATATGKWWHKHKETKKGKIIDKYACKGHPTTPITTTTTDTTTTETTTEIIETTTTTEIIETTTTTEIIETTTT